MANDIPDYTGVSLSPPKVLAHKTAADGAFDSTIAVDAGVHALALVYKFAVGPFPAQAVAGVQTGINVFSTMPTGGGYAVAPFFSAIDAQVRWHTSGGQLVGADELWLVEIFDTQAVNVFDTNGNNQLTVQGPGGATLQVALSAIAPKPAVNNVLDGTSTVNNGTIITIPAGRTWYGSLAVNATSQTTGVTSAQIQVASAGGASTPATGTILLGVAVPQHAAGGVGAAASDSIGGVYVIADAAFACSLKLVASSLAAFGTAIGVLL